MSRVPSQCKRHPVATAVLVWLIVMTPLGMSAEAAFHLDHTYQPTTGLRFLPDEVQGLVTAPAAALPAPVRSARRVSTLRTVHRAPTRLPEGGSSRCGGDLPPCWVMRRESGPSGDPNAYNPTGCSGRGCYGKWQCDPRTCDGTGTEEQQDAEARRVWNNGKGCSHWNACGRPHD